MKASLRSLVRNRAEHRCEYCQLPEAALPAIAFHVEHIVPRKHGGTDATDNLAQACYFCNLHKGPNLTGIDPSTRTIIPLFHPRQQHWAEHFRWSGPVLIGRTATGRATVQVLAINLPHRVRIRKRLMGAGLFFKR
ncbi:MAG: HNH endonuclease signature motif containing protein [Planctomycetota bacterium]|nr:HNH endonuclease signature motif containing protein [Planctomycetota bacterium]